MYKDSGNAVVVKQLTVQDITEILKHVCSDNRNLNVDIKTILVKMQLPRYKHQM